MHYTFYNYKLENSIFRQNFELDLFWFCDKYFENLILFKNITKVLKKVQKIIVLMGVENGLF
jgi:hypothetical protein